MLKILINEPDDFPVDAINLLGTVGEVYTSLDQCNPALIDVLFVRLSQKLDANLLSKYAKLGFLVTPTTGLNHIDQKYTNDRGIEILSLRGRVDFLNGIRATAEHTIAILLALIRKLPAAANHVSLGGWDRHLFKGSELSGKKVLILGYGRVGQQLEKIYSAFGCVVVAHDIDSAKVPQHLACNYPEDLCSVDFLSVHVSLNSYSEQLINDSILSMLPQHAIIVNTSRGEVIDQEALFERLRDGNLAGAALDVLVNEPNPFDPKVLNLIKSIDNHRLLLTPHLGGFTSESLNKVELFMAQLLINRLVEVGAR